jgi:hypothetical protein
MTPFRAYCVALLAVLSIGFIVTSAPAKDWKVGLAGFLVAVFLAWAAIMTAGL